MVALGPPVSLFSTHLVADYFLWDWDVYLFVPLSSHGIVARFLSLVCLPGRGRRRGLHWWAVGPFSFHYFLFFLPGGTVACFAHRACRVSCSPLLCVPKALALGLEG